MPYLESGLWARPGPLVEEDHTYILGCRIGDTSLTQCRHIRLRALLTLILGPGNRGGDAWVHVGHLLPGVAGGREERFLQFRPPLA